MVDEKAPKIALDIDFESNHAFFFAIFVLCCGLTFAVRDHRRRRLQENTSAQEDRLYIGVLSILFFICLFATYYAMRRQMVGILDAKMDNAAMQRRIEESIEEKLFDAENEDYKLTTEDPLRILFIVGGGAAIATVVLIALWFIKSRNEGVLLQKDFRLRGQNLEGQNHGTASFTRIR